MDKQRTASSDSSPVAPATVADTRNFLIERSGRTFTPLGKTFIQNPDRTASSRRAPLAQFVTHRDHRGLLALLMLHTIISSGDHEDGWSASLPLPVWARAFATTATATDASAKSAATKILTRLQARHLIERRHGGPRAVVITLLSPDGSAEPYTRPIGAAATSRFIRLNHRFWTEEWDTHLSLPAVAMLLVALHEKPGFPLPTERMPAWYGWSADTAERGLRELRDNGLLHVERRTRTSPLSPTGLSTQNLYTLQAPFDPDTLTRDIAARTRTRP
ncbi:MULTISPECIES: hypothetical protein [Arsenicicoccus]|uniref:hypothetical protein n=1 Tax=Arsenicicoccus TaxID=267408 RepID=UPI0002F94890|nr:MULTISPECIES: hypothetical protein [Arsenicicoccus]